MAPHFAFYKAVMFQPSSLSRRDREAIAVTVSRANGCVYCVADHAAAMESLQGGTTDPRLLAWAEALARDPSRASEADIVQLRGAGLDDRAILDAILTVGYFAFVNRLVLATGLAVEAGFEATCRPDLTA